MDCRRGLTSPRRRIQTGKAHVEEEGRFKELKVKNLLEVKNLLKILPTEIRYMIWRLLLLRRAAISPGFIKYNKDSVQKRNDESGKSYEDRPETPLWKYRYQWDDFRQNVMNTTCEVCGLEHGDKANSTALKPEFPGGYHSKHPQHLSTIIPTEPTFRQAGFIARGESMPFTFSDGSQVRCEAVWRGEVGNLFLQVNNHMEFNVQPLNGLAIMRVNKQILAECREVLYGENTFAFNTVYQSPENGYLHYRRELEDLPELIPGLPNENGTPKTPQQVERAIDNLFDLGGTLPTFLAKDPLTLFFHRIGRMNTSLLTKIKIDGQMKSANPFQGVIIIDPTQDWYKNTVLLGLSQILPILTTVVRSACPNLGELTLNMENIQDEEDQWRFVWNDSYPRTIGKSDEERIEEVIEKVVDCLDNLKVLKLGVNSPPHPDSEPIDLSTPTSTNALRDPWGKSARWIKIVKERATAIQAAEQREIAQRKSQDGANRTPTTSAGKIGHHN